MSQPGPQLPRATARLLLRDFVEADWRAVHDYARRPEVARYMPWGPNSEDDTRAFVGRALAAAAPDGPRLDFELAVVECEGGRLVGGCGLSLQAPAHRRGFVGYCLHPEVWGRGYATEATAALLAMAFADLGLHRVVATCDAGNAASARVLEKSGFRREGCLRHDAWRRGQWRDTLLFGLLEDQWRAAKAPPRLPAGAAPG